MNRLLLVVLLAPALVACQKETSVDTPAAQTSASAQSTATFNGYDKLIIGMNALEVQQAWGRALSRASAEGEVCYYFVPDAAAPDALAFMMEGDKFVRYDIGNADQLAPGGGKVGMTADDIRRLYPDRVEEQQHARVEGSRYLRIKADDSDNALLFETDAAGRVTSWRVGQKPYVDYTSRCD